MIELLTPHPHLKFEQAERTEGANEVSHSKPYQTLSCSLNQCTYPFNKLYYTLIEMNCARQILRQVSTKKFPLLLQEVITPTNGMLLEVLHHKSKPCLIKQKMTKRPSSSSIGRVLPSQKCANLTSNKFTDIQKYINANHNSCYFFDRERISIFILCIHQYLKKILKTLILGSAPNLEKVIEYFSIFSSFLHNLKEKAQFHGPFYRPIKYTSLNIF